MILVMLIQTSIMILFVFLQSTVLKGIFFGITPDIALLVLISCSQSSGSFKAQTSGFITGLFEDIISLSPLGFHSLIKTLVGSLFGLTKGKIFIDSILLQIVFSILATIFKYILIFILGVLFLPLISKTIALRTIF